MAETSAYRELVVALNRLQRETGTEALSIRFSRSDIPVDWDDETRQWVVEGDNG